MLVLSVGRWYPTVGFQLITGPAYRLTSGKEQDNEIIVYNIYLKNPSNFHQVTKLKFLGNQRKHKWFIIIIILDLFSEGKSSWNSLMEINDNAPYCNCTIYRVSNSPLKSWL